MFFWLFCRKIKVISPWGDAGSFFFFHLRKVGYNRDNPVGPKFNFKVKVMKQRQSLKKGITILVLLTAIGLPLACTTNNSSSPTSPVVHTPTPGGPGTSTFTPTVPAGATATFTPTFVIPPPTFMGRVGTAAEPNQLYYNGGNLYVAESGVVPLIEEFALTGSALTFTGGTGFVITGYPTPNSTPAFTGVTVNLSGPQGFVTIGGSGAVALLDDKTDGTANIYVGDFNSLNLPVTTSSYGSNGLSSPLGITADSQNHIYVANTGDGEIDEYDAFGFPGSFPLHYWNGWAPSSLFKKPCAIACDSSDNVYIADKGFSPSVISEFNGGGTVFLQSFSTITGCVASGIAIDGSGDIYVSDSGKNQVEEYDSTGNLLRAWGRSSSSSQFANFTPTCIAFTGTYILVGDAGSNRTIDVFQ
jgi:hypothetical protein